MTAEEFPGQFDPGTAGQREPAAATSDASPASPLLVVDDLHVWYGVIPALFGASLTVPKGSVLAVLGANGAGKSTLARALSGLVPAHSGKIGFNGEDITGWPAHRVRRAGLTYLPEGRGIFPGLSVLDNLRMGVRRVGDKGDRDAAIGRAFDLFPVLSQRRRQQAGSLSGGEQQMLSLARGLAVSPALVVADEMSLGLAPKMVDLVFESLDRARQTGVTIIMIEQFVHRALAAADSCIILQRGVVAWTGPAGEAKAEVLDRYLGEGRADSEVAV
jgi:branched-chain amino acid transport system ATP-binding protein